MDFVDVFACKMNVELQGENIDKLSEEIWDDVENLGCVEKCFNGGTEEISDDIISGRMVDVIVCGANDVFGSDMNVDVQGENNNNKSADIYFLEVR